MKNIILSLYDHTGEWSRPWKEAGYHVITVDIQNDGMDARLLRYSKAMLSVYGILAAPPCTQFALSGNRHRAAEKKQPATTGIHANLYDERMVDALSMVDAVLRYVHSNDQNRFDPIQNFQDDSHFVRYQRYPISPRLSGVLTASQEYG